ncbi:MAG: DUF3231 family protein [Sporolactobacillus sp.]
MPTIAALSKSALEMMKSLTDNQVRPVHVGEAMCCWTFQTQLDGILGYCETARNQTTSKEVVQIITHSHDLAILHKQMLDQFMKKEQITPSDGYVVRSDVEARSLPDGVTQTDKEVVNTIQINATVAFSMTAGALSQCLRHDLQLIFFKIMTDVMLFNQEIAVLSEQNGWLRMPPVYHP